MTPEEIAAQTPLACAGCTNGADPAGELIARIRAYGEGQRAVDYAQAEAGARVGVVDEVCKWLAARGDKATADALWQSRIAFYLAQTTQESG